MKYKVLGSKKVKISYKGKARIFQLMVKRAFVVLTEILKRYPNSLNIHDLNGLLHDPNRALSSLRHENGFSSFLDEKRDKDRVVHVRIDLDKLFSQYDKWDPNEPIILSPGKRVPLSEKDKQKIVQEQNGRCNITGLKLDFEEKGKKFMEELFKPEFNHRIPLFKGGSNDRGNFQLLSRYCNQEKTKICTDCDCTRDECKKCALAYPEKYSTIKRNDQSIDVFKKITKIYIRKSIFRVPK